MSKKEEVKEEEKKYEVQYPIKVKIDKSIEIDDLKFASNLKCTLVDLLHFFGDPESNDRFRYIWKFTEKNKEGDVRAIIHDLEEVENPQSSFMWGVSGHVSRSFEIIVDAFQKQFDAGKTFVSMPLNTDNAEN